MIRVTVVGAEKVKADLARKSHVLSENTSNATRVAVQLVRQAWFKRLSGVPGNDPFWGRTGSKPPLLGVRSGATRGRLGAGRVFRVGEITFGSVGHPDQHVADMEEGGTRSYSGTMGRIPTRLMQTPAGVDRNAGRSIRGAIPGSFVLVSKRGNLWIARRHGKTGVDLLYLLVRTVKIPKYATAKGAADDARPRISAQFRVQVRAGTNA